MAKIAKELSALAVSKLSGEGAYAVGGVPGLHLQIIGASRVWVLRFMVMKKRRRMGLGSYPQVTLAKARELAREAHNKGRAGIDPIDERRLNLQAAAAARSKSLTFTKAAELLHCIPREQLEEPQASPAVGKHPEPIRRSSDWPADGV